MSGELPNQIKCRNVVKSAIAVENDAKTVEISDIAVGKRAFPFSRAATPVPSQNDPFPPKLYGFADGIDD